VRPTLSVSGMNSGYSTTGGVCELGRLCLEVADERHLPVLVTGQPVEKTVALAPPAVVLGQRSWPLPVRLRSTRPRSAPSGRSRLGARPDPGAGTDRGGRPARGPGSRPPVLASAAVCTECRHGRIVHRSFYADYLAKVRGDYATEAYQKAMRKWQVWAEPLLLKRKNGTAYAGSGSEDTKTSTSRRCSSRPGRISSGS
jgi:hypothetical protein